MPSMVELDNTEGAERAGKHPSYAVSPMARANWLTRGKPGCPASRKRLTKAGQRAKAVRMAKGRRAASAPSP